jgi:hypothetical protein
VGQTNGRNTTRTTNARTTDAETMTTDARVTPTRSDESAAPTQSMTESTQRSDTPQQPERGEMSNTYAERVDLENALTNSATSPRLDTPSENV